MSREQLDAGCQKGILGLVLAILLFAPLATGAVRTLEFLVVQGLTVAALGLWAARLWLRSSFRVNWPPVNWVILAFVGYAAWRYSTAEVEFIARGEFIRVLVYASLYFIILDTLSQQETTQVISFGLIAVALGVSMYAIYQYLAGSNMVWHFVRPEGYKGRGSGTYICPNHLAGLLELVVPLALAYTSLARFKPATKVFFGYAACVMLAAIGISFSRGGWAAALLALIVFLVIVIRNEARKLPYIILLAALVAGAVVFITKSFTAQRRMGMVWTPTGELRDVRVQLWGAALQVWKDHPWIGAGPAHFDTAFRKYRPRNVQARPERVHNDYLNTLADWGIIGAGLVAAIWGMVFWGAVKTWRFVRRATDLGTKPSNRSAFVLGASVGLFAILLHSVVDFNMHIPANAIVAVTLMALLVAHTRHATERYLLNFGWAGRIVFTLAAASGIFVLSGWGVARAQEYRALEKAGEEKTDVKNLLALYQRAHEAEPKDPRPVYEMGERLRLESWRGEPGYEELAREAMTWFELGMKLNPLDSHFPLRYGMCLHWLGRHEEAGAYFEQALKLDPQSYYAVGYMGWHYFQLGDYKAARKWLEESYWLNYDPKLNTLAITYIHLLNRRDLGRETGEK